MKCFTTLLLSTWTLLLGHGCDTQGAPSAPLTESGACEIAAKIPVGDEGSVTTTDLSTYLTLEESAVWDVLPTLGLYGLKRYTYTFAASQVTYLWWSSYEAQDEALDALCGP